MLAPMLDAKGTKILAKSLFKELRASGYNANQILGLSTELIDLVTRDLRAQGDARPAGESFRGGSGPVGPSLSAPSRCAAAPGRTRRRFSFFGPGSPGVFV